MKYKELIKNQETRIKLLGLLDFLPDRLMIHLQYFIKMGKKLNLKSPKRFNEKIQWYKLYYRDPLMTKCADKYSVREYVSAKGYDSILIPLYGLYSRGEEINFQSLPKKFVLKTTNGSHTNIICKDKEKLDKNKTIMTLNQWVKKRTAKLGREWAYYNIEPKIICEMLLEDNDNEFEGINDYKFVCINGKAEIVWIDIDRYEDHKRNFYDLEWKYLNIKSDVQNYNGVIKKPNKLQEMKEIAEDLAEDFPQVRVDLYLINDKIYFGELTFYLLSGYEKFYPDYFDYQLGEKFILPEKIK
ncbi:ATP-grasp fold amidoligase family protein [Marinococcus halophilus]|uniref:Glycosyl transferase n=1 Tax=Marinococcus halophilus TaxID=1371 RepID=A0A510Y4H6_MARHA|nr:ATP-grasp fold amidoligase family protein [Marinococcus halophilus]GEK57701.1 glycosyl transferase [Marinococcus halophilus]